MISNVELAGAQSLDPLGVSMIEEGGLFGVQAGDRSNVVVVQSKIEDGEVLDHHAQDDAPKWLSAWFTGSDFRQPRLQVLV